MQDYGRCFVLLLEIIFIFIQKLQGWFCRAVCYVENKIIQFSERNVRLSVRHGDEDTKNEETKNNVFDQYE